ncbi:hypothetical protein, partial [Agriterribacter sp.]|uniref:hypothetical protein n=1 Tax=Agriterribacter sp. TaxID=2821509 RepID=UPI002BE1B163
MDCRAAGVWSIQLLMKKSCRKTPAASQILHSLLTTHYSLLTTHFSFHSTPVSFQLFELAES